MALCRRRHLETLAGLPWVPRMLLTRGSCVTGGIIVIGGVGLMCRAIKVAAEVSEGYSVIWMYCMYAHT